MSDLKVHNDSQLVVNQVNGIFKAKDKTMNAYLQKVKEILRKYEE